MTTLDDVERTFSSDVALVCDAEGPSGIAGIMGGQISEVSDKTTRVLMEAATWVGPNIMRTSKALGAADGGVGALREAAASRAGDRGAAARRAAHGRALRRPLRAWARSTSTRGPRSRASWGCARNAWSACSARASRSERVERDPRAARLRACGRGVAGAALARRRRPARGRPDRGGRPHPRARQAAHDAARARGRGRAALGRPAPAPPDRGPAARPRPPRVHRLRLHLAGARCGGCASATSRCCGSTTRCRRS